MFISIRRLDWLHYVVTSLLLYFLLSLFTYLLSSILPRAGIAHTGPVLTSIICLLIETINCIIGNHRNNNQEGRSSGYNG